MGMWGFGLYQNDTSLDVKDEFERLYSTGNTSQEITDELKNNYKSLLSTTVEKAMFWFALADSQWNYGVLLPEVKEKALYWVDKALENLMHQETDISVKFQSEKTLKGLQTKLLSSQPPIKKVVKKKVYKCQWKVGDVFAYQLESELAKERGFYGRYFLIRKVDETTWYPGHIVPIVYVKITDDDTLPTSTEEYNGLEYVQTSFTKYEQRFCPIDMSRPQEDITEKSKINYQIDEYGFLPEYRVILLNTSKKVIPAQLFYIGNFSDANPPQNEFVPHAKENIVSVSWKLFEETFETKMIKRYCGHNLRELSIYNTQQQKEY